MEDFKKLAQSEEQANVVERALVFREPEQEVVAGADSDCHARFWAARARVRDSRRAVHLHALLIRAVSPSALRPL